jgi:hypothetical protein
MRARLVVSLLLAAAASRAQAPVITAQGDPSISSDSIYHLAVDPARHRGESFVILLDDGVERVDAGGKGTRTYRQVVQVLDLPALLRWTNLSIPYDPVFGRVRVNWARVLNADGSIVSPALLRKSEQRPPSDDPGYAHGAQLWVHLGGAEPGMLVDVSYTTETDSAYYGNDLPVAWRINTPSATVLRSRLIVDVPDSLPLHITEINVKFARRESAANGRHTYTWATTNVPRVVDEPFSTDSNGVISAVVFNNLPSWTALGDWYATRARDRIVAGGKTRKKVDALTKGARTWSDSVHAIYQWVAQNVYQANRPIQQSGYSPREPDATIGEGLGDSQDKSILAVAMLRQLHVDAAPVLDLYPSSLGAQLPSLAMLRAVLIRITHGKDTLFADPQSPYLPLGVLPRHMQGGLAIVLPASGGAVVTRLPIDSVGANLVQRTIVGRMDSSGTVTWRHTVRVTGVTQAQAREAFASQRDSAAHQIELDQDARADFPGANGDSLIAMDGRDLRAEAGWSFTMHNGHTRTAGTETLFRLPYGDLGRYVAAEEWLSNHTPRHFPIDVSEISGDSVAVVDLKLTLPPGWKAVLPLDVDLSGPFGAMKRTYSQQGRELHVTQRIAGARGTLAPERVNEMIAWLKAITADRASYLVIHHTGG